MEDKGSITIFPGPVGTVCNNHNENAGQDQDPTTLQRFGAVSRTSPFILITANAHCHSEPHDPRPLRVFAACRGRQGLLISAGCPLQRTILLQVPPC